MKKTFSLKKIIAIMLVFVSFFVLPIFPASAQTKPWGNECIGGSDYSSELGEVATLQGVECLVANVLSVAITGIGLAGFVMLLVGSYRYLISGGNSKGTESARSTITFALVGLVVALSSFIVLNLIADFTGVDQILKFDFFTI